MKYDKDNKHASVEPISPWKNAVETAPKPEYSPCGKAIDFSLNDSVKPSGNKENKKSLSSVLFDSGVFDNESTAQEDSGYLSLHNSQIEHEENDLGLVEHCGNVQEGKDGHSLTQPVGHSCEASQPQPNLPQLQFQVAACKHLVDSYRKTKRFDMVGIKTLAKHFGLHNVIGGKMGLDHVDIVRELWERDMKLILAKILPLLDGKDLITCKRVSRTWKKVILQDDNALKRCCAAEWKLGESGGHLPSSTQSLAAPRVVLSRIQGLASTPIPKSSKRVVSQKDCKQSKNRSQQTRSKEFQEVASTLKQHESLKSCKLCGSPARCNPEAFRATCVRDDCGFDFCTQCLCEYHGSSRCRLGAMDWTSQSRASLIAGSARSKRNTRRL